MPNLYYKTVTYKNGGSYAGYGYDKDGSFVLHGKGVFCWGNATQWAGDRYEGDFVDGRRTGKGTYYYANGDRYEGDFVDGKCTGKGTYYCGEKSKWAGDRYEGDFVDGMYTGKGTYYFANGKRDEGDFVNGVFNGKGKTYWSNGNLKYQGEYLNDKYHGYGKLYHEDGSLDYEGFFENGNRVASNNSENTKSSPVNKDLDACLTELDSLIGLEEVKQKVRSLFNAVQLQNELKKRGLPATTMSYHMVFTGNPGTGKTTVARLIGQIYAGLGVLSKGQVIETDRKGLVGEYIGSTAPKTDNVIQEARGGVLFIDEAYELYKKDASNDFGTEAIACLLKRMEDFRDDLIVIVAGYKKPMEVFLEANPGFKSRFNHYIHFENYSLPELVSILKRFCGENQKTLQAGFEELFADELQRRMSNPRFMETFSNGRYVRNLFEKLVLAQGDRLSRIDITKADNRTLLEITAQDLQAIVQNGEFDKTV